jgi:hypothetical protein
MPMIAITTNSSTKVKPRFDFDDWLFVRNMAVSFPSKNSAQRTTTQL